MGKAPNNKLSSLLLLLIWFYRHTNPRERLKFLPWLIDICLNYHSYNIKICSLFRLTVEGNLTNDPAKALKECAGTSNGNNSQCTGGIKFIVNLKQTSIFFRKHFAIISLYSCLYFRQSGNGLNVKVKQPETSWCCVGVLADRSSWPARSSSAINPTQPVTLYGLKIGRFFGLTESWLIGLAD